MVKMAFLGNCQAGSLCESAKMICPSPDILLKHFLVNSCDIGNTSGIEDAKKYLLQFMSQQEYSQAVSRGIIKINPSIDDLRSFSGEYFVVTMFHEAASYYRHRKTGFLISISLEKLVSLEGYFQLYKAIQSDFDIISNQPLDYFARFERMLIKLASEGVADKFVVFKRISSTKVPANSISWLRGWSALETDCSQFIENINLSKHRDMIYVVNGDSHFEQYFSSGRIEPIELLNVDAYLTIHQDSCEVSIGVDIEHLPPSLWQSISQDIFSCLQIPFNKTTLDSKDQKIHGRKSDRNKFINSVLNKEEDLSLRYLRSSLISNFKVEYVLMAILAFRSQSYIDRLRGILDTVHLEHRSKESSFDDQLATSYTLVSANMDYKNLFSGLAVAIWGAGGRAKYLLEYTDVFKGLDIKYIVDASAKQSGKLIHGLKVVTPQDIPHSVEIIFVASTYYYEIKNHAACIPLLSNALCISTDGILLRSFLEAGKCRVLPLCHSDC